MAGIPCTCLPVGCCNLGGLGQCADTSEGTCELALGGSFVADGSCGDPLEGCITHTPTITPTVTQTATPTGTPVPNGGECTSPAQCASRNCVDGICLAWMGAVPAISTSGLAVVVAILLGLGVFGTWRIRDRLL